MDDSFLCWQLKVTWTKISCQQDRSTNLVIQMVIKVFSKIENGYYLFVETLSAIIWNDLIMCHAVLIFYQENKD